MTRLYGRSEKGTRCNDHTPGGHWKTMTLLSAIRSTEVIQDATVVCDGAMDGDTFLTYVEQCLVPSLRRGDVVVMDNLASHKVAGVREAIEAAARLASPDQAGYSGTQMRDVGDYCLLICSFVPVREHVQVSKAHDYVQLGRGAYWQLATSNTGSVRKLFTGLCDNFCQHVRLLQTVQENESLGPLSPLESHAWWQKTGSSQAYQQVRAYTAWEPIFPPDHQNNTPHH